MYLSQELTCFKNHASHKVVNYFADRCKVVAEHYSRLISGDIKLHSQIIEGMELPQIPK